MNILKNKRFIATTLTFVMFMALVQPSLLTAKERRGSMVVVTMTDGSHVKGELLAVKNDVLLLYDQNAGQGMSIALGQVAQVKLLKEPKLLEGFAIGIGIGLIISINNLKKIDRESLMPIFDGIGCFLPLPISGLCGGIIGALVSIPKKFSMAGASSQAVQENFKWLKHYAREQDFEKQVAD